MSCNYHTALLEYNILKGGEGGSLVPRLCSRIYKKDVVTFDPANFPPIFARAVKDHTIVMTLAGESLGTRLGGGGMIRYYYTERAHGSRKGRQGGSLAPQCLDWRGACLYKALMCSTGWE